MAVATVRFWVCAVQGGAELKGAFHKSTMPGGQQVLLFVGSPRVKNLAELKARVLFGVGMVRVEHVEGRGCTARATLSD